MKGATPGTGKPEPRKTRNTRKRECRFGASSRWTAEITFGVSTFVCFVFFVVSSSVLPPCSIRGGQLHERGAGKGDITDL